MDCAEQEGVVGLSSGASWAPSPPPDCRAIDLSCPTTAVVSQGAAELSVAVQAFSLALERVAAPRAVSVPIRQPAIGARSFWFAAPPEASVKSTSPPLPCPAGSPKPAAGSALPTSCTRVQPPQDVIKLEDRLHYILQPSLESICMERALEFPFPPFPYQMEGTAFLYPRHAAILADEMGLGKTMQTITAIRLLLRSGELSRVLLVCPKPLVTNWKREFTQWAPEVPLLIVEGDQARRSWLWRLPGVPLRVANYELICRDRELFEEHDEQGRPLLDFDLVVLDESQRIKNRLSTTSQVVRSISRSRSWALTGTPVENSAEDLVGIFEFLAPGVLSAEMKPRRMGQTVRDYVLRRTKDQVLTQLPPKLIHDTPLELTAEQRESYQLAEQDGVLRLSQMEQAITIQHVFELVLRLKQICNFDPATGASAKLERLEADLEEVAASGRKAIVFSQWVTTITQLSAQLRRFGPLEYHGQIPSQRRDAIIERFRNDPQCHVMLMSYGAGSVGLNLQFAGYVFLFDRWWNPAVEDQAINRAHRIGASGPVTVERFLTLDTIEERIDRVLQEKRELFETIFSETDPPRRMGLTQAEIFGLFQLKCPSGPIDAAA